MLRLAYENGKLQRVPVIRKLQEADPRSGFFEPEQFEAVKKQLSQDLQVAVTLAYTYGWRMQSEVLALERRHPDLEAGTLRLDAGMTKNRKGRVIYLTPEVKTLLAAQMDRVKVLERKLGRIIPFLFPHFAGAKIRAVSTRGPVIGEKRDDFRKAWLTACKDAGVPGKLRHDFRRTAARNLIRRGVPERVAMTITGHLTRSVFDRYNIVSDGDLRDAARKLSGQPSLVSDGHVFGHNVANQEDTRLGSS
jgi:integrase